MFTYSQAVDKIHSLLLFGSRPGLDRIYRLLNKMGNPQDKLKFVHVAGTNGKGSVSVLTSQILREAGYKTGLFISPYVIDFRERIQVNNQMISKEDLAQAVTDLFPLLEDLKEQGTIITEFEFIMALSFYWYEKQNCDVVVLETGMGGALDCTNVIKTPLVSVITSIGYDHTAILGDKIEEIAAQKAGIIKQGGNTVFYPQEDVVNTVIEHFAVECNNTLLRADEVELEVKGCFLTHTELLYKGQTLKLALIGKHQIRNAKIVLSTVEVLRKKGLLKIADENIKNGFNKAKIPARLELISEEPIVLLDGAHNPDGMRALGETIKDYLPNKKIVCIMGMLNDKDSNSSLEYLDGLVDEVITLAPDNPRKQTPQQLAEKAVKFFDMVYPMDDFGKAVDKALELAGSDGVVLACGSLYLAAQLRPILIRKLKD